MLPSVTAYTRAYKLMATVAMHAYPRGRKQTAQPQQLRRLRQALYFAMSLSRSLSAKRMYVRAALSLFAMSRFRGQTRGAFRRSRLEHTVCDLYA